MTDLSKDEESKNRWAEQHRAKKKAKKAKKGWKGRATASGNGASPLGRIEGDALCPEFNLSSDLIAVCIRLTDDVDPERFAASVSSLLNGKHQNIQVIVLANAATTVEWEDRAGGVGHDPRVLRIDAEPTDPDAGMQPNTGHAAVARLTRAPYIAFQGPHDLSSPERLADQLAAIVSTQADACYTPARDPATRTVHHAGVEPTAGFGEMAPNTGLFTTDVVKRLGGIHPAAGGLRLLTSAVAMLGKVATTKDALYVRRGDHLLDEPGEDTTDLYQSLFTAAATSVGTAAQLLKSRSLRARDRSVSDEPWASLGETRLPLPELSFVESVLRVEFPDNATARQDALGLLRELADREPKRVLLAGHPAAVLVASMYAEATGARVVALDADPDHAAATRKLLGRLRLERAEICYAKVREQLVEPVGYVWYEVDVARVLGTDRLDYVYLDPGVAQHGALFHLSEVVGPGTRFQLAPGGPGTGREGAALDRTLDLWRKHGHIQVSGGESGDRYVDLLNDPDSAEGIVVTVLTGARPKLFLRTLKALAKSDARLVREARVVVLVNGGDELSCKVAAGFDWVDMVETTEEILPVPDAVSRLMGLVGEGDFVFHLEDDWECKGEGWRQRAVSLLRGDPTLGQVLLGIADLGGSQLNPVSGRRFSWEDARSPRGVRYRIGPAAYSLRPSLMRLAAVTELWPSPTEAGAMEEFHGRGEKVARLHDPPFHHIGGDDSLREKLGR